MNDEVPTPNRFEVPFPTDSLVLFSLSEAMIEVSEKQGHFDESLKTRTR